MVNVDLDGRNPKYVKSTDPTATVKQKGSELVAAGKGICMFSSIVLHLNSWLRVLPILCFHPSGRHTA